MNDDAAVIARSYTDHERTGVQAHDKKNFQPPVSSHSGFSADRSERAGSQPLSFRVGNGNEASCRLRREASSRLHAHA
ncbi:hypothetical protein, partial [Candidatus Binatus sp.]|uniref:hypothetical protein n=1 Tax=Candidatus Binatus sp. TaxID=2811406 RepID=UPI003CC5E1FC